MSFAKFFKDVVRVLESVPGIVPGDQLLSPEGVSTAVMDTGFYATFDTINTESARERDHMLVEHDITITLHQTVTPGRHQRSMTELLTREQGVIQALMDQDRLWESSLTFLGASRELNASSEILTSTISVRGRVLYQIDQSRNFS